MIKFESTGNSIDEAIEKGLKLYGISREDVHVEILNIGGIFKDAKVAISFPESVLKESEEQTLTTEEMPQEPILQEEVEEKPQEVQEIVEEVKPEKKEKSCASVVKTFLDGFFKILNLNYSFEAQDSDDLITINLRGNNLGDVIGYKGSGIDALQYLITVYISKNFKHGKKVHLDIDNFKQKRKQNLEEFAKDCAEKLLESENKELKLEPMNSFERFVVHDVLKNYSSLETHSEGEEPNRFLIISKK